MIRNLFENAPKSSKSPEIRFNSEYLLHILHSVQQSERNWKSNVIRFVAFQNLNSLSLYSKFSVKHTHSFHHLSLSVGIPQTIV